jgi:hypothetical protein
MNDFMQNSSDTYKKIHFAIMAIEASAKKQNISGNEMYNRLKKQDLINLRLIKHYDLLHTQSLQWVVENTIETLENWERES